MPGRRALVLAGGGVIGGMYEVGALTALDESLPGFRANEFDLYVGSSSGSVVGSLMANGIRPRDLYDILDEERDDPLNFQRGAVYDKGAFRTPARTSRSSSGPAARRRGRGRSGARWRAPPPRARGKPRERARPVAQEHGQPHEAAVLDEAALDDAGDEVDVDVAAAQHQHDGLALERHALVDERRQRRRRRRPRPPSSRSRGGGGWRWRSPPR